MPFSKQPLIYLLSFPTSWLTRHISRPLFPNYRPPQDPYRLLASILVCYVKLLTASSCRYTQFSDRFKVRAPIEVGPGWLSIRR
jgi:hypothetical protein